MRTNPMPEFIETPEEWIQSFMPKIDGKFFRCECGCNVFAKSSTRPDYYKCNSCNLIYLSE